MNILLFCDDEYHPGEVAVAGMKPLESKGYKIDAINDTTDFDPNVLPDYDVIVMSKCDHITASNKTSWKTQQVQEAFVKYVENGGGLIVSHSGTVKGEATDTLDCLAGCRFESHPNDCPVTVGALKPHPITEGVGIFREVDEHYHLEILTDDCDILAASYAPPQGDESKYSTEPYFNAPEYIAPSVLIRTQGKGRVCVLAPGHHLAVWRNPEFQRLLDNALRWCAKKI